MIFPEIITLCGSARFKKKFLEIMRKLTLEGKIVVMPGFEYANEKKINEEQRAELDELHLRKIDISDGIYVIDVDNYIGEGTQREIRYAKFNNKFVKYYSAEERK